MSRAGQLYRPTWKRPGPPDLYLVVEADDRTVKLVSVTPKAWKVPAGTIAGTYAPVETCPATDAVAGLRRAVRSCVESGLALSQITAAAAAAAVEAGGGQEVLF